MAADYHEHHLASVSADVLDLYISELRKGGLPAGMLEELELEAATRLAVAGSHIDASVKQLASDPQHAAPEHQDLHEVCHRPCPFGGVLNLKLKNRAATKARKGINPFTKEPCVIKAKPASKTVRAIAMKKLKEMVN